MKTQNASLNDLLASGWARCGRKLVPSNTWPASEQIVLEKDGAALVYSYSMYEDSNDCAPAGVTVQWREAKLVPVTLFEVRYTR